MKFIVMSDIHYMGENIVKKSEKGKLSRAVSRQALLDAANAEGIDTILITGDLTDHGERESHLELIELLKEIKMRGKKIFVLTATHDFNHHKFYQEKPNDNGSIFFEKPSFAPFVDLENPKFYNSLKPEYENLSREEIFSRLSECVAPEELWQLYRDFGPSQAYSVEESSFSYCVQLGEDARVLMLNDIFRNEEALEDKSASYSPTCFKWINKMVQEAKRDGKFIFACAHHPLVPPSPAYRIAAGNRDMRSPYTAHILADMGINLAFTGHTHFSNIEFARSPLGNTLCDITTPSPRFFPPCYRIVDLKAQEGKIKYKCVDVTLPQGFEIKENSLREYYRNVLIDDYKTGIVAKPINKKLSEIKVKKLKFFLRPLAHLSEEDYEKIKDENVFDIILNAAFNMVSGDGAYTPRTPEYKLLISLADFLDSIIDAQPFVNVNKFLKGYTVRQVIEPLCYNNFETDNEGELTFTVIPQKINEPVCKKSYAGECFMAFIYLLALALSRICTPLVAVGIPALTMAKKFKLKKEGHKPDYLY